MIKFQPLTAAAVALAAIPAAASATPLARVGVGQVYNNVAACAAANGTYAPSEAAQAYARAHPATGTPVFGANATGTICVLMHTSVPGRAEDGRSQGDHWVRVPRNMIYRAPNGGMIYYRLCNNPILQMQEEVAARVEEGPCLDCVQPQPARQQVTVSYTTEAAVTYAEPQRVAYQGAPVQFTLPGQSIGQGLFPQSIGVSLSNVNYTSTTNHFTLPGASPVPPFGGVTQPPAGNGFGGVTQPPRDNGFGGTTMPPAPLPGPVPGLNTMTGDVPSPTFGGGTGSPLPNPVFNGGGVLNGVPGALPGPVYNGGPGANVFDLNTGSFGGSTSTFTGTTGVIQGPINGGGSTIVNGGLPGPVQNGNGTPNPFGGTTGGQ